MGQGRLLLVAVGLLVGVLASALWLLEDFAATEPVGDGPALLGGPGRDGSGRAEQPTADDGLSGGLADGTQLVAVEPAPEDEPAARFDRSWLDRSLLRSQRLSGRVLDGDGEPIAGAELLLLPEPARLMLALAESGEQLDPADFDVARARSRADGRFELVSVRPLPPTGVSVGSTSLLARAEGHGTVSRSLVSRFEAEYDLGDITLGVCVSAHGRVIDEQGRPLAGVAVFWTGTVRGGLGWRRGMDPALNRLSEALLQREAAVVTGADGRFELTGLRSGWGSLALSWQGGLPEERERQRIDVDDGDLELGDVQVPVGRQIAGRVSDELGRALPGARVFLTHSEPTAGVVSADESLRSALQSRSMAGVACDAEGRFVMSALERPVYSLYAVAPGRDTLRRDGVAPGAAPLELTLPPVAGWDLQLVDPEQQPVPLAEVRVQVAPWRRALAPLAGLTRVPAEAAAATPGGAPGRFRVAGLASDLAVLTVSADGLGVREVLARDLEPDADGVLQLELVPLGGVTGVVVTGPERTPVAGARVELGREADLDGEVQLDWRDTSLASSHPSRSRVALTAADGSFRFDELAMGLWRPWVRADGFLPHYGVQEGESVVARVDPAGEPDTLEVLLHRAARVEGLLLDHDGQPVSGRTVRIKKGVLREQSGSKQERTDADGRFAFADLPAGVHTLWTDEAPEQQLQVQPGPPAQVSLYLSPPAVIQGRLLFAHGPAAGGRVRFWVLDPDSDARSGQRNQRRSAEIDEQGRFRAEVRAAGTLWVRGYGEQGQATPEQELTVAPGGSYSLELRFPATRLAGVVVDGTSEAPLDDVRLTLRTDGQRLTLRSGDDGRFDVAGLAAGSWRLSASHDGYESASLRDLLVVDPDAPVEPAEPVGDTPASGDSDGDSDADGPGPADALRVALSPKAATARLHGTVVQADGSLAYDGTTVTAEGTDEQGNKRSFWGGPRAQTRDGEYLFEALEAGSWELVVQRTVVLADGSTQEVELVRRRVTLLPGDDQRLDLPLGEVPTDLTPPEPDPIDPAMLEQLEALGYGG